LKLHLVSLGCARNLVDSELMLGRLMNAGWTITGDPGEADTIVVNTCSFIESAANESIDTILQMAGFKQTGACRRLIVAGCLPERYREKIIEALPEVDCFLGTGAFGEIVAAVKNSCSQTRCHLPDPDLQAVQGADDPRLLSTPHTAYLKIAEGCSRHCTYCIIPKLRGGQKSRRPEDIVSEARTLIAGGVKELTLVAQDTTAYGRDLNPETGLDRLLENLSPLSGDVWFRVLYGHPDSINEKMMRTIDGYSNICSYMDIPIQHASSPILKKMGRDYTADDLFRLFDRIRALIPGAALRTTVIVGFPGETDRDFDRLLKMIEGVRFDHLGAFTYSDAEDLPSHRLSNHVPAAVARQRYDRLMTRQQEISRQVNQKHVGQVYPVLLEKRSADGLFTGRTAFQAPEVDGITYVQCGSDIDTPKIGDFLPVRIIEALAYDLIGEAA